MKYYNLKTGKWDLVSCPARGTWIEIVCKGGGKFVDTGRAPQGARGLKSTAAMVIASPLGSCPARGTWIEIPLYLSAVAKQ